MQQIAAAKDQWQQAKAAAPLHGKTYERIASLHRDGVMSLQKRDEAWTAWQAAKYSEGMAWQQYQMALEGRGRDQDRGPRAGQDGGWRRGGSEAYLADTRIASPTRGSESRCCCSGELAPQGFPVVTLLDMKDAWAQFHIRETSCPGFPVGTEFDARIPGLGIQTGASR